MDFRSHLSIRVDFLYFHIDNDHFYIKPNHFCVPQGRNKPPISYIIYEPKVPIYREISLFL